MRFLTPTIVASPLQALQDWLEVDMIGAVGKRPGWNAAANHPSREPMRDFDVIIVQVWPGSDGLVWLG